MKLNEKDIYNLYTAETTKSGLSKNCTMPDSGVKELEIGIIEKYIKKIKINLHTISNQSFNILEIGCGNGFTASQLSKHADKFIGSDINGDMINIAKKRKLPIQFIKKSVLSMNYEEEFDVIYTERCLMNLVSWENQKKALHNIQRALKPNGCLIMIETFTSGWEMLNRSRNALGLEIIPIPAQSTPYKDEEFEKFINNLFSKSELLENNDENFLSTYYYGARILYPSLIRGNPIEYNNPFIQMFKYLPPILNYSPVQLRLLEKK